MIKYVGLRVGNKSSGIEETVLRIWQLMIFNFKGMIEVWKWIIKC